MLIQNKIYLDNNATTKVDEQVVEAMKEYFLEKYAVASSQFSHTPGILAKEGLDLSRHVIAQKLNAKDDEIIFTSGDTESNNLAIKGLAFANLDSERKKIIVSAQEEFSVLHTAKYLEKFGFKIETVNVDKEGFVDLNHLKVLVDDKTLLVSINHVNHEVGNIQDLETISKIVKEKGAYFHSNGTWAFMFTDNNVENLGVDLYTIAADKIHGPKGVGALYVKKGVKLEKILHGGFQEFNLRAGLENVPGAVGFAKAVEIFCPAHVDYIRELRDLLYNELNSQISGVRLNGPQDLNKRVANNLNVSFDYVEGEALILHLDIRGIAVITGSACFSRSLQASHVLLAMGYSHERAHGSVRYSLSRYNKREEMLETASVTKQVVEELRKLSPLTN